MATDIESWYRENLASVQRSIDSIVLAFEQHSKELQSQKKQNARQNDHAYLNSRIAKTKKLQNHALRLQDKVSRHSGTTSQAPPGAMRKVTTAGIVLSLLAFLVLISGVIVLSVSSFWIGAGLCIGGFFVGLIALVLFIDSKFWIAVATTSVVIVLFLITVIVLIVILH